MLYQQTDRHSAEVKALVEDKVAQLNLQLKQIRAMRNTLQDLAATCPADESSQCTILNHLAEVEESDGWSITTTNFVLC